MTVEQHDIVDFVSFDREENPILIISDHLPWDDLKDHLWHLQEKPNAYLRFLESGEISQKIPESARTARENPCGVAASDPQRGPVVF